MLAVGNGRGKFLPMFAATAADAGPVRRFLTTSLARELGILLSLSVMFPFMIHLLPVPEDARLGPRLLPMFYAPLLAALLGRTQTGLIVAVVAPWLNWALTTHPTPRGGVVMTIQLLAFVLALHALVRGCGSRWFLAAPAYLASMAVASLAVGAFPALIGGRSVMPWVAQGVVTGLPGLAILVAINWLVVRTYPSDPRGGGPLAA